MSKDFYSYQIVPSDYKEETLLKEVENIRENEKSKENAIPLPSEEIKEKGESSSEPSKKEEELVKYEKILKKKYIKKNKE